MLKDYLKKSLFKLRISINQFFSFDNSDDSKNFCAP